MLNAKALSDVLSRNRDERLCKRWWLMTPNGTLLAHSQPADINDLRKQAALAAISWQKHSDPNFSMRAGGDVEEDDPIREDSDERRSPLHVLAMEEDRMNVLVRLVQKQLLLVLEGGVPPRKAGFERRVTAESADGTLQCWPREGGHAHSNGGGKDIASSVLKAHRSKLDALAQAILADFQQTGFKMPEEGATTVF